MNKQFVKFSSAVALLLSGSSAKVKNSPNGLAGPAPCVDSYNLVASGSATGGDIHFVHGLQSKDGSIIGVGSGKQFGEEWSRGTGQDGIVIKVPGPDCKQSKKYGDFLEAGASPCDSWVWKTNLSTKDKTIKANWAAESPDGSFVIVGGIEQGGELSDVAVWKLDSKTGKIVWKMNWSSVAYSDGIESVNFASDGSVIVGGYVGNSSPIADITFKSAGQITGGVPFIAKISAEAAKGSETPEFEWMYYSPDDLASYKGSTKAMRLDAQDNIYAVVGKKTAVFKLDKNGNVLGKSGVINSHFQAQDLELAPDGGIVIGGLMHGGWKGNPNGARAAMMKVDKDFNKQWKKMYGNYPGGVNQFKGISKGDPSMVIDECWGMMATSTGYVMSCGTGIENCDGMTGDTLNKCLADPRRMWRNLVFETDSEGERVWSRMDSWQGPETSQNGVSTSAAEYVFPMKNGQIGVITDEGWGMGFMTLRAPDGKQCKEPMNEFALAQTELRHKLMMNQKNVGGLY